MFNKNRFYSLHTFNHKSLIALAVLAGLMIGGATINDMTASVSAHARTYRVVHVRRHHHVIRRHRRYHYNRKEFAEARHVNHDSVSKQSKASKETAIANDGNNEFARKTADDIFQQINAERKANGLKPLAINTDAQRVANERNRQIYYAYTHYSKYKNYAINNHGNPFNNWIHGVDLKQTADDDAKRLNISDNEGTAENAGNVYVKGATKYIGGSKTYNVTDPKSAAYANVDNMTNDDSYSGWGHRENILDKDATGIGVASYYNPQTNYSTNVEDFSYGNNPKDI